MGGAAFALAIHGMPILTVLVAVTAIIAPGVEIGLALCALGRPQYPTLSGALGRVNRWFRNARRWSMVAVFMLGCLVPMRWGIDSVSRSVGGCLAFLSEALSTEERTAVRH